MPKKNAKGKKPKNVLIVEEPKEPELTMDEVCITFGKFEDFRNRMLTMRHGTLPPKEHPSPYILATIDKMHDWSKEGNELRKLKTVCFHCKNRELFSQCRLSLKAMVGECEGLFNEARMEYVRMMEAKRK